jgi:hypothetical protein
MTRAQDTRPTRRLLSGWQGEDFVVELEARRIVVRPKGTRRGGRSEVAVTPSLLYDLMLMRRVEEKRREKRKARRKGGR